MLQQTEEYGESSSLVLVLTVMATKWCQLVAHSNFASPNIGNMSIGPGGVGAYLYKIIGNDDLNHLCGLVMLALQLFQTGAKLHNPS